MPILLPLPPQKSRESRFLICIYTLRASFLFSCNIILFYLPTRFYTALTNAFFVSHTTLTFHDFPQKSLIALYALTTEIERRKLQEHFVPFRAYLGKNYKTSTDEGLVGDDNDATSIIEDTGAETEVYLMLTAYIEREEAKLQIKKEQLQNNKPAGSAKKKAGKEIATTTTASGRKVKVKREKLDDDSSVDSFLDSDED